MFSMASPDVNNRVASDQIELREYGLNSALVSKPKTKISIEDLLTALRVCLKHYFLKIF